MKLATRLVPTLLVLALAVSLHEGKARADSQSQLSPTFLGLNGVAVASTKTSADIAMDGVAGTFNQLTLTIAVTKGTSAELDVTCTASTDGTNFSSIQSCTGDVPAVCLPKKWTYDLTVTTSIVLNIPANYRAMRCAFLDPAGGTGTIIVRGTRGKV